MATTVGPTAEAVVVKGTWAAAAHKPPLSAVIALATAGAAAAATTVWGVRTSTVLSAPEATAIVKGLFIATYVAVGAYTWWRRPQSRLGQFVLTAAFLYALTSLGASSRPVFFTFGRLALAVLVLFFIYVFLCFPSDRISSQREQRFWRICAIGSAAIWSVAAVFAETLPRGGAFSDCATTCPENALQLVSTPHWLTRTIDVGVTVLTAAALAALIVFLYLKARAPMPLRRRAVVPLLYAAAAFTATYATYSLLSETNNLHGGAELRVLAAIAGFSIPLALLVGQFRGRIFAATNLWQVLARAGSRRITPVWVEFVLRDSLGDESFTLAMWEPQRKRYVDAQGAALQLPEPSSGLSVSRHGTEEHGLALIYDSSLDDEPEIVQGLGATAVMLLDNARLVQELQASRARIVDSAERERRRLERDLHDGAQQRLMAMQIKLALARDQAGEGELGSKLDELSEDASAAVQELRALAHGIYPTVLRERGVGDALHAFAKLSPTPVKVVDRGVRRAASGIEAAVYYCALEAIQNAVKHAGPNANVTVMLAPVGDRIEFEVSDEGTGFDLAEHADGFGIVSMEDRIGAMGGTLEVDSSPGRGTRVFGSVPLVQEAGPHGPERKLRP
jgi:signal transduction histidine kinase